MMAYRIELTPDDNDTLMVTCPAIPEVKSFGDDEAQARHWGALAIQEAIAGRIHDSREVPLDTISRRGDGQIVSVALPLMIELKVDLYRAVREAGITRAELTRRLGWNRNSVDRLFDINHASRLEQIEAALAALGFRIDARLVASQRAIEPAWT